MASACPAKINITLGLSRIAEQWTSLLTVYTMRESRKFIDLILEVSNKWTNFDAHKEIKVGDFGLVDRATGELQVEGNLYDHPETASVMTAYPAELSPPLKVEKYTSQGVKELGFSPSVNAGFMSMVEVGLEGQWEFTRQRGALLVLTAPRMQSMKGFPTVLSADKRLQPILKNKVICTDVVSCPGFCLYLNGKKGHVFSLSLKADVPIPVAPGIDVGGGIGANWKIESTQGLVKTGLSEKGEYIFFPLYTLKRVNWGRVGTVLRDSSGLESASQTLADAERPWKDLDDEGEELDLPVDSGEPLEE